MRLRDVYKDMTWKTWDGREVSMRTATQEHISNAYWYTKLIRGVYDEAFELAVMDILKERFDGELLPYVPAADFKEEHTWLEEGGFVIDGNIWYKGKIVGHMPRNKYYILLN